MFFLMKTRNPCKIFPGISGIGAGIGTKAADSGVKFKYNRRYCPTLSATPRVFFGSVKRIHMNKYLVNNNDLRTSSYRTLSYPLFRQKNASATGAGAAKELRNSIYIQDPELLRKKIEYHETLLDVLDKKASINKESILRSPKLLENLKELLQLYLLDEKVNEALGIADITLQSGMLFSVSMVLFL